jgi:branched-chain amino acid transport system ATP-binding protein
LATERKSNALVLDRISAGYGGNQVLHGVSVEVPAGQAVLVLGPNGTGKSTLLSVASGLVRQRSGRVIVHGTDVSNLPPHKRARLGLAHVPEGRRVFPRLSVGDNLLVGTVAGGKDERDANFEWVFQLFPVLERKRTNVASTLSGGEQQMLAIAQAVMSRPSVLLLDEPSAGLAPILARQVFERVQLLRERGISVLMVEQVVGALEIADTVYVMRNGEVVAQGAASAMKADRLSEQYLGSRV